MAPRTLLRAAVAVELLSLVVLLVNLATAHLPEISSLAGPVHGCAYLFTVIATVRDPRRTPTAIACAALPGIGGMLALRQLSTTEPRRTATAPADHEPHAPGQRSPADHE